MSQILITGGAGYIGSHIIKVLLELDKEVIVLDNLTTGSRSNLPPNVKLIEDDIATDTWQAQLEDVQLDAVIHLAALTSAPESVDKPDEYKRVNELGSRNVWQFCQDHKVSRVLYASTAAVYGDLGLELAREDSPTHPMSPYGLTKLAGENLLFETCPDSSCYSLRLFNVGGGQDSRELGEPTVIHALNRAISASAPFTIYGDDHDTADGTPVRDFVHVEDVARAFVHFTLSEQPHPSGIYNVGTGQGVSIRELAGTSEIQIAPRRAGDISYSIASIDKITETGWQPTHSLLAILS